ncbi:kinetochore Spc7 family protein [Velocimicrobium porci]|uniref:Uncharacterized protein n=1 Tax=Velocimicrobium porci TaxID=2606634 RepID=A0A6L5XZW8_9FIRM|nr:hypothetical protein [Velocimicrobium porci]MSS64011.1 hypothetical protein [Velocimicrobium porci]
MSDNEVLKMIFDSVQGIKTDIQTVRTEMREELKDVKENMQEMREELQTVKADMQEIREELQIVKEDIQKMKENVQKLENDFASSVVDLNEIKQKVKIIDLSIENETNRNIKIIAEGHLDLARKLDNALKIENEKEILLIRVNTIENELIKVKEYINQIA